jgi:transcriptional regulator with XRE-family HTH domain
MAKDQGLSLRVQWLGKLLRMHRERAGYKLADAGEYLKIKHNSVSRIENGVYRAKPSYVRDLVHLYGVSDPRERDMILQLNEDAWRKDWYDGDTSDLEMGFIDYTWLEDRAARLFIYDPLLINGLLQTPAYARALSANGLGSDARSEAVERMARLKLARQKILDRESPTELSIVLEEIPLRRRVGDLDTQRAQLKHLLNAMQRKNIDIRVLPSTVGWHDGLDGPFSIIAMPDPFPDVVYLESLIGRTFLENETKVANYRRAYDGLYRAARNTNESTEFIETVLKELE